MAEDERTRKTEEAISKDVELQRLDELCSNLPKLQPSTLETKAKSIRNKNFLVYGYSSPVPYGIAKQVFSEFFIAHGWVKIQDGSGLKTLYFAFEKEDLRVTINHGGLGERIDYAIECEKIHS